MQTEYQLEYAPKDELGVLFFESTSYKESVDVYKVEERPSGNEVHGHEVDILLLSNLWP